MTHPLSVNKVADKSVAALTRDKKLSASDMRALVFAFRNPDPTAFPMTTLPAAPAYRDNQSVLLLDSAQAAPMLARLRGQAPVTTSIPKIAPSTVTLKVENGSGAGGAASRAQSALAAAGFQAPGAATDADRSDYTVTEVRYGPGGQKKAELVLAFLGGAGKLVGEGSAPKSGTDVVVVLGQDFQQVSVPATTTTPPPPTTKHQPNRAKTKAAPPPTTSPPLHTGGPVPVAGC
jgi:hypothetical protein